MATKNMSTAAVVLADEKEIQKFSAALRGKLILPGDKDYEEARKVYNAMIDKRPAMIVQCVNAADVILCVNFARENKLPVAIRSGGHNVAGLASVDDGLVIDLSLMKGIHVDPKSNTALVEAGCTLGDVDHATHAFGKAIPTGTLSTTGLAGLTLGGGIGHLTRKYGLSIDNLLSVDMVLADGRYVTASAEFNPDLFWAIRGGGGNFGVITDFVFRLNPVDTVYAGPMIYPLEKAAEVMKYFRDFILKAPEDITGFFVFLNVPPGPPFPVELQKKNMCGIVWNYVGPIDKAEDVFRPIRKFLTPALDLVGPIPYPALQSMFDPLLPAGLQHYWKADFIKELNDQAIAAHIQNGSKLPTLLSQMHLYPINGAAHRVKKDETAFGYRDANFAAVIVGVDPDPMNAGKITQWARDYWNAIHPYSLGGGYVNFIMEEGQEQARASYGDNYQRLAEIKKKYDPTNFFRINQNIVPAR
jgi:FAD/FMN-containing dehydrogenase